MRKSKILDCCFVIAVVVALAGFFAGVAYSIVEPEPGQGAFMLLLRTAR